MIQGRRKKISIIFPSHQTTISLIMQLSNNYTRETSVKKFYALIKGKLMEKNEWVIRHI